MLSSVTKFMKVKFINYLSLMLVSIELINENKCVLVL